MKSEFFTYGDIVTQSLFAGREQLIQELLGHIESNQSLTIYGHRRVGKTSLIHEALRRYKAEKANKNHIVIFFDLSKIINSKEFLVSLCRKISESLDKSKPIEQKLKKVVDFITSIRPISKFNAITGEVEHSIEFTGAKDEIASSVSEALELLKSLAKDNRIILVLDEFHTISKWDEDGQIQWHLRSQLQSEKNILYIFSGSSSKIIERIFMRAESALYRSGGLLYVDNKIALETLIKWMRSRFKSAKMQVSKDALGQILDISRAHPYYTQKLCHRIWLDYHDATQEISVMQVLTAAKNIIAVEEFVFQERLERLSYTQQNVLLAIAKLSSEAKDKNLSQIHKYSNLNSKTSTQSALKALDKKEDRLIMREEKEFTIEDPFFELWLQIN